MRGLVLAVLVVFFLCVPVSVQASQCEDVTFQSDSLFALKEAYFSRFPVNLISYMMAVLDDIISVSPQSPADFEMDIWGMKIYPLSWIGWQGFDVFFQGLRIIIVVLAVASIVRHLLEVVL